MSKGRQMKAGRKRKPNAARTAGGRISRAHAALNENAAPLAVRQRMFDLTEANARDQKAATFVGRLCLMGTKTGGIDEGQYEAAIEYKRQRDAYRRALSAPDSLSNASRGGTVERGDEEHAAWCKAVIAKYEGSQRAVMAEQCVLINRGMNLIAALDYLVLRDQQLSHMIGDLRVALNALVRHYRVRA